MKKIVALLLALVMVLSLGTVAFAESTKTPVQRALEGTADIAAALLFYPSYYAGVALNQATDELADKVDGVCMEIYNNVHELAEAVNSTVEIANNLVEVAKNAIDFGGKVLDAFGMDSEELLSLANYSVAQIDAMVDTAGEFNGYVDEIMTWIAPLDGGRQSTYAGQHVMLKGAEIAGYMKDSENFGPIGWTPAPVATAIYNALMHYYQNNFVKD